MDISLVYELMERLENSSLDTFELETADMKLKLGKNRAVSCDGNSGNNLVNNSSGDMAGRIRANSVKPKASGVQVRTKVAGTFYSASGPDSEPFVKIGSKVKKGDVIGIIEAMKMMNDIVSPADGTITQINVANEQLVGYDELLMTIEE